MTPSVFVQNVLHYIAHHKLVTIIVSFAVFLACSIGFVELAEEISEGETLWFDEAILTSINNYSSPFWDAVFIAVTQLGGVLGVITITAGILALLLVRRKFKSALIIGASVSGAALLNVILKFIFERARPDLWQQLVIENSYSFPSGHAMISATLGLSILVVFWNTRYRIAASIVSISYILIIGFSRLYLGVHYPTDILAGWLVSIAWVIVVVLIVNSKLLLRAWKSHRKDQ